MSPAILGPLNMENMVLSSMIGIIIVAASMKENPIQELTIIAEADRIEEPFFRERQTTGIYNHIQTHPPTQNNV